MSAKKKKDSGQPELPIEGAPAAPAETKRKKSAAANGNGAQHVVAETVEAVVHKPFDPKKLGVGLHTRVDRGFLDYASYVIRDRAIPNLADGLKPVQRRILWAMHEKDDGRFIKVANVIGDTMKYHPHGNASIDDALVVLTNKRYLIEGQGNFGNIFTGDPAAASRYIECRLYGTGARTEVFNDDITEFIPNYDGRRQRAGVAAVQTAAHAHAWARKASRSDWPRGFCRTIFLNCSKRRSRFSRSNRSNASRISPPVA